MPTATGTSQCYVNVRLSIGSPLSQLVPQHSSTSRLLVCLLRAGEQHYQLVTGSSYLVYCCPQCMSFLQKMIARS